MRQPKIFRSLLLPALLLVVNATCRAQGQLAGLFERMSSPDQKIRKLAETDAFTILDQVLPHIETEIPVLKSALVGGDPYIRLQASAILNIITTQTKGQHDGVVLACMPEMLRAADDDRDRVQANVLFAMANVAGGAPPASWPTLTRKALSGNGRVNGLAAMALLQSKADRSEIENTLKQAIGVSQTSNAKQSIVRGIISGGPVPEAVADAAAALMLDPDPDVQKAVIDSLGSMYGNREVARAKLTAVAQNVNVIPSVRKEAGDAVVRLDAR